jgi:IS4 transposase
MAGLVPRLSGWFYLYKAHGADSTRFDAFADESDISRTRTVPHQNTVFRQLTNLLPWGELDRAIERYRADKGVRRLPTSEMLLTLLFAHAAEATSLRDIEAALAAHDARRYHSRLPAARRSTLADALATRPAEVFTDVLSTLIAQLTGKLRRSLGDCLRLIDSTPIRLNSLSADWARFSRTVFGAKAHIIHDPDADCPLYLVVTPANVNDITVAKTMPIDAGATYVFDLGYDDYAWWAALGEAACRIVTRLKSNTPLRVIETRRVAEDAPDILSDRVGFLPERLANSRRNPIHHAVREIRVKTETGKILRIVSNDLDAPAGEIAALYKRRWAIELFFRWIKQRLRLKHFYGASENAVRIQIAVALIAFVLIKLAHLAQSAVPSLTRFARLIGGAVLSRKRLDRFGPYGAPPDPPPPQNKAQGTLLWA